MESVLHKRYKIGERLFSNSLGELFLGRDLQATTNQRLLIHYLPPQLLSDTALKQSLSALQQQGNQANTAVLQVLDCAWSDTEVFFVLETPEAWSLSVLPAVQGQPTNVHQKALNITQQLIDQSLITKGIDPALFLVTPTGDLYLLGTAFLTELRALEQTSLTLLQPQPPLPPTKKPSLLPLLLLGGVGLVAAGSLGVYQFAMPSKQAQALLAPSITVSELDKPLAQTETTALVPIPETHKTTELTNTGQLKPSPALPAKSQPAKQTAEPAPVLTDPKPVEIKPVSSPNTSSMQSDALAITLPAPIPPKHEHAPNPQAAKHLEQAIEAIQHGHLQTGLYYLRLAKKLEANQEQLQTAAKQLLEQAQLTGTNETLSPPMQTSIKQEFNLE